ncbi:YdeI/OmpD-associated family protein [Paenibacillus senegalimassiliensis]|uniref:YdeI/OmpD-associated family protein n=1 Tax=Paenibacillus senegalimassiliensis TaxID=1737426 RepID=UPI00073F2F97|nr:YdeI/OmpD-associated family protein [Paenibacillus senegalimassiliensis]
MEIHNLLKTASREELRQWLEEHAGTEKACWVVVSMTPVSDKLLYLDVVEEALCFGWIDGIKKKLPEGDLAQRISPRSNKSSWTELNKERARRLEKLGLMREQGRLVLPDMDPNSFIIDEFLLEQLKADDQTYQNFVAFPNLYQRIRIDTIQSYKNQPDVFHSRLEKFLKYTRENKMYGQWHDDGRLLKN